MALSNAERQKKYRQSRKEKVSEFETLRNINEVLTSELNLLRNEHNLLIVELKKLRNENADFKSEIDVLTQKLAEKSLKPKKYKVPYDATNAEFYISDGDIKMITWPETTGTILHKGFKILKYSEIDSKFKKYIDCLIFSANERLRSDGLLPPDGA